MNQFFGMQYSQEALQQQVALRRGRNGAGRHMSASMIPAHVSSNGQTIERMVGGETLDDIIAQNDKEMQQEIRRRRSLQPDRSPSELVFGSRNNSLGGYQYPTSPNGDPNLRRQSTGQLEIGGYEGIAPGMNIQGPRMAFSPSMEAGTVDMDTGAFPGLAPQDLSQNMMGYGSMGMEGLVENPAAMNMFVPSFSNPFRTTMASMPNDFMIPEAEEESIAPHQGGLPTNEDDMMPGIPDLRASNNNIPASPTEVRICQNMEGYRSTVSSATPPMRIIPTREPSYSIPASVPVKTEHQTEVLVKNEPHPQYENPYSKSGFDMLGALTKVASRKNPEINIGKVDLSCAFVVCNVLLDDCPIIYASDVFERMTGYTKFEILGRNCRFLQSPEGEVECGSHREFVDNNSVLYLRSMIAARREAQRSLINYRKGGQPFMNLLTMIPISGEDDKEIKYYVGFQVDLVEKPTSVEGKDMNGMYSVDYTQVGLQQYQWQSPQSLRSYGNIGQVIGRDGVSSVLNSITSNPVSEAMREIQGQVLLENTDDVVHVLSLKGLFLYLSPSCRQVLEYDASELMGTALSSICHPSDIVPVTRELKDSSTGVPVSIVFRIRRKRSGYTWFESHGSLSVEQSKTRKCIILVGRERPIYALSRRTIDDAGGIGENEIWAKLSTSAMFLFVSANVQTHLDRSPDELVGTSLQALMRPESRARFGRALEKARAGEQITYKHDILNKRGLVMLAQTILYPGDTTTGRKPTFLIAQTRLLKPSPRPVVATTALQSNPSPMGSGDFAPSEEGISFRQEAAVVQDGQPNAGFGVCISDSAGAPLSEDNLFDELKTTHCTSWQFELRQMEKSNRLLSDELASLLSNKKKRKRRKGAGNQQRDCANCHTRVTPEWRRGPSGMRDLCNSCGLRWAKQVGRGGSDQNAHKLVPKG